MPCRAVSPFTILENIFLSPNPLPCNYLYIVSNFCLHGNKFGPGLFLVASRLMRTVQKTRHPPKPTREPVYAVSLLGWGQVEVEKMKKNRNEPTEQMKRKDFSKKTNQKQTKN